MKKKILIMFLFIFLLCGCTNIYDESIDNVLNGINNYKQVNTIRRGYNYYLPSTMQVKEYTLYNDVIEDQNYTYYLYVDLISYFNKVEFTYEEDESLYYSKIIGDEDIFGYVEIKLTENNQYLIEIVYNYAKIIVMVDKDDINLSLSYCTTILSSIEYNDSIIENLVGKNLLNYEEVEFDPFKEVNESSNYMKRITEEIVEENNNVNDEDLVN